MSKILTFHPDDLRDDDDELIQPEDSYVKMRTRLPGKRMKKLLRLADKIEQAKDNVVEFSDAMDALLPILVYAIIDWRWVNVETNEVYTKKPTQEQLDELDLFTEQVWLFEKLTEAAFASKK